MLKPFAKRHHVPRTVSAGMGRGAALEFASRSCSKLDIAAGRVHDSSLRGQFRKTKHNALAIDEPRQQAKAQMRREMGRVRMSASAWTPIPQRAIGRVTIVRYRIQKKNGKSSLRHFADLLCECLSLPSCVNDARNSETVGRPACNKSASWHSTDYCP